METKGWTQHDYAKNANGDFVETVEDAACFCGLGAIRVAAFNEVFPFNRYKELAPDYHKAKELLCKTIEPSVVTGFAKWQDEPSRTFPEVKEKFLQAIALAEEQESRAA